MVVLNDESIRTSLIRRLGAMSKSPKVILEELRVHNGNAVADVVAINNFPHCYEIKGNNDSILRAVKQGYYYDRAFRRTTLVTTEKHLQRAITLVPSHWGLIRAKPHGTEIILSYVRAAQNNPGFDKRIALLTLWKSELIEVATPLEIGNTQRMNRHQLSEIISLRLTTEDLVKSIGEKLVSRQSYPAKDLSM